MSHNPLRQAIAFNLAVVMFLLPVFTTPQSAKALQYDRETGLYYNRARTYNPELGRFQQRDPHQTALILMSVMLENAKTPMALAHLNARGQYSDGMNLYQYAKSNPLGRLDPSGELALVAFLLLVAVAAVVGGIFGAVGDAIFNPNSTWSSRWGAAKTTGTVGGVAAAGGVLAAGAVAWLGAGSLVALSVGAAAETGIDEGVALYQNDERTAWSYASAFGWMIAAGATFGYLGFAADASRPARRGIRKVGGQRPKNYRFAGGSFDLPPNLAKKYPNGVKFTDEGFPDFSPYSIETVKVDGLVGSMPADGALANLATGKVYTPAGHTWHHVEDGVTMQLVPSDLHEFVSHTGGAAVIRHGEVP